MCAKQLARKIAAAGLLGTGAGSLYRIIKNFKPRVTILMYHRVSYPGNDLFDPGVISASPEQFEQQMRYLARHCTVISFDELLYAAEHQKPLPENAVVITFDDGYKDNYGFAFPILKQYGLPATIFLTTGHLDNSQLFWWDAIAFMVQTTYEKRVFVEGLGTLSLDTKEQALATLQHQLKHVPERDKQCCMRELKQQLKVELPQGDGLFLSWDEVREMGRHGISWGAHTVTHPILTRLDAHEALHEIKESMRRIEEETGTPVRLFAYPNGMPADMNDDIDDILRAQGIRATVSACYGTNEFGRDLFRLKRVGIGADDDLGTFMLKVTGMGEELMEQKR